MATDLATCIAETVVADTHEHMRFEEQWIDHGPSDVLADLFENYVNSDRSVLISTHEIVEIEEFLTDVIFIDNGKILLRSL